jgi:carboxypeptidase-like protein
MRTPLAAVASVLTALTAARAQTVAVAGQVFAREEKEPLASATVSVVPQGTQLLANENGQFTLRNLSAGEIRLRFKRIGFVPKDTVLTLAGNDTARIRIEMTRLAILLPAMVVNGKCTDGAPFEEKPVVLAELFDQVKQNAEQLRLLTRARPFVLKTIRVRGYRARDNRIAATRIDTIVRPPMPEEAYAPRRVLARGEGVDAGLWLVKLPELSDFADTAFMNSHCLQYAGQTRFESDSVIQVDFEPVPWLNKDIDIAGSIYLRVDGYQLVALVVRLNRIPSQFRDLREFSVRARFTEFVAGVPVLSDWELTNTFRNRSMSPRVEIGQVVDMRWLDSLNVKRDSVSHPPM